MLQRVEPSPDKDSGLSILGGRLLLIIYHDKEVGGGAQNIDNQRIPAIKVGVFVPP